MARISYDGIKEAIDEIAATKEQDYIPSYDMKEVKLVTTVKRYRSEYYGKRRWWK